MSGCDVCEGRSGAEHAGVACIPLHPISVAYCASCLSADAHPLYILDATVEITAGDCNDFFWDMYVHSVAFADVFAFNLDALRDAAITQGWTGDDAEHIWQAVASRLAELPTHEPHRARTDTGGKP